MTYYNEHDRFAAQWLRNLAGANLISGGTVDERDVQSVRGADLAGVRRAHFFAGIGGWDYALRLAGWDDEKDGVVWTGSCPCQPFSIASPLRKGVADARHVWPEFRRLISECLPPTIFGEQVSSPAGRDWLAGVRADLEALGYRVGAADLCAAGLGAPHIRQRLYWVADRKSERFDRSKEARRQNGRREPENCGGIDGIPYSGQSIRWPGKPCLRRFQEIQKQRTLPENQHQRRGNENSWKYNFYKWADGTTRRIESGTFPLAYGVPGRVGLLRGYGNAIIPQVAAQFIRAFMETENQA